MSLVSALVAPLSISNAIKKASRATGTDFSYLLKTAARESSFKQGAKAKTSSAAGLFQFIESTWLKTVKDVGDKFGLDKYTPHIFTTRSGRHYVPNNKLRQEILQLRHNPEVSAMMAGAFTQQNSEFIASKIGRDPSPGELYIAHFLGPNGASDLISLTDSKPNARADRHFPRAARANRPIFYSRGRPRTVKQVYNELVKDHAKQQAIAATKTTPATTASSLKVASAPVNSTPAIVKPVVEPIKSVVPPPPANRTVAVQKGDTLYKIASRHGVSIEQIKSASNLKNTRLSIGQELTIPGPGSPAPQTTTASYTVKRGDSVGKIARMHSISQHELQRANGIKNPNLLRSGQQLKIPGQVVSQPQAPVRVASRDANMPLPTIYPARSRPSALAPAKTAISTTRPQQRVAARTKSLPQPEPKHSPALLHKVSATQNLTPAGSGGALREPGVEATVIEAASPAPAVGLLGLKGSPMVNTTKVASLTHNNLNMLQKTRVDAVSGSIGQWITIIEPPAAEKVREQKTESLAQPQEEKTERIRNSKSSQRKTNARPSRLLEQTARRSRTPSSIRHAATIDDFGANFWELMAQDSG